MAGFEYPHIGEKINEVLKQKLWTKTELARQIGMSQGNSVYLTKKESIDVVNLHKISVALKFNFFKYYPVDEGQGERDKEIGDLKAKIAELEKQLVDQKSMYENLQKENGYLKQINDLLARKKD